MWEYLEIGPTTVDAHQLEKEMGGALGPPRPTRARTHPDASFRVSISVSRKAFACTHVLVYVAPYLRVVPDPSYP